MKPIIDILSSRVSQAMKQVTSIDAPAVLKVSQNPKFGDYQANGIMGLAKKVGKNPRELAGQVIEKLDVSDMCDTPEIAGPGFINFRLTKAFLKASLAEAIKDDSRLGIDIAEIAIKTVIDYSAPNVAKQMHVGHLRSTIIGDVISRILEFFYGDSDSIVRQNHIGDWGLQMGMVVWAMEHADKSPDEMTLADLEAAYRKSNALAKEDPSYNDTFRDSTVKLQSHAEPQITLWNKAREISLNECFGIYKQLNVKLDDTNIRGESFYSDKLPDVISSLDEKGMLKASDGAECVFMDEFKNKDDETLPLIVKKSDGAFLYATTDLAAIRFRSGELKADRVIYVTDARQKLHFQMVFACVSKAGWVDDSIALEHVPFGSVMGEDGKPFKTRSGENIKLRDLLEEATKRALEVVQQKNPELPAGQKQQIADAVGIGAVKYADLSNNLASDYVFSWDKMLAMEGNTAPYMQYAYARVKSIFRKGEVDMTELVSNTDTLALVEDNEIALAKTLLRFGEIIENVARDLRPHILTGYLFDVAQAFNSFYSSCPVLKSEGQTKTSRLLLSYQTAQVIKKGLELLGIETIEQM